MGESTIGRRRSGRRTTGGPNDRCHLRALLENRRVITWAKSTFDPNIAGMTVAEPSNVLFLTSRVAVMIERGRAKSTCPS